jgi:DNA polymerase III delta prime subunit
VTRPRQALCSLWAGLVNKSGKGEKMEKGTEKVFIAWGGNQPLANFIGIKLKQYGFNGVVGGGVPTDMFIGTQIISQINQCTRAIILLENKYQDLNFDFSNNLMFEWGYLTAKVDPRKLHIFLIGVSRKNLPSDLSGIWATEIAKENKTIEQIAQEIIDKFRELAYKPIEIDKTEIFNRWAEIKQGLITYSSVPIYSEIELAHYLLHSIEVCYGYMEEEEELNLIDKITPASSALEFAIQIVKSNIVLFKESAGLTKQVTFDTFSELKSLFERKFDFSNQDKNLNMWFKYFCSDRLGLLYLLIVQNDDFDAEHKIIYLQKAAEYHNDAMQILKEIAEKYPQEAIYTKLYEGYVYRDLYKIDKIAGRDAEKKHQYITAAVKAHEIFYLYYKQRYPSDGYLIKHFGNEYYLNCAERLNYINDPIEKKIAENSVRSFLSKLENESGRQHIVLKQLRLIFDGNKNKERQNDYRE